MSVQAQIATQRPKGNSGSKREAITDSGIIEGYLSDASRMVGNAEALFRPENEKEIAEILKAATEQGVGVTVVAEQTSTTGSSVPHGGWVLSMEKFKAMGTIDADNKRATAQGGIILGVFQAHLEAAGLFYPPDPTSCHESTLGASVACNASGARTFLYGATRDYVEGLRVVLANGEVLNIQRGDAKASQSGHLTIQTLNGKILKVLEPTYQTPHTKHSAGYHPGPQLDLVDLFIGSEGTLGVITEVTVRCLPAPDPILGILAFFPTSDCALDFVDAARHSAKNDGPITPRCLEWLDGSSLAFIRQAMPELGIPPEATVGIFSEQEMTADTEDARLEGWLTLLENNGALLELEGGVLMADSEAKQAEFRKARHAVPAGANEMAARNGMPKMGTDLAVPNDKLRGMMKLYAQAGSAPKTTLPLAHAQTLLRELGYGDSLRNEGLDAAWKAAGLPETIPTVTFGHIGDNHLHLNFLPDSPNTLALCKSLYVFLTEEAIKQGGTPSAEHGIGKNKRWALHRLLGQEGLEAMGAIKETLDPNNTLGRGNFFEDVAAL